MQKNTQLLKWSVPLLTLLVIGGIAFSARYPVVAKADGSRGSCQLIWGAGGNTQLDPHQVTDDNLQGVLRNYQLNCTSPHQSCQLTQDAGDTDLNFDNIQESTYIINGLAHPKYNLACQGTPDSVSSAAYDNTNGRGSCSLVWGADGQIQLDLSRVTDTILKSSLQGAGLNCTGVPYATTSCNLALGSGNDTQLNVDNLQSQSPWLYAKLHYHYSLDCGVPGYKPHQPNNLVEVVNPAYSTDCGYDRSQDEGDYISISIGNVPICDYVNWQFSDNEKGKTCDFTMNWYGGHTWALYVYTTGSDSADIHYISDSFTLTFTNVAKMTVGMNQTGTYDVRNSIIDSGAIAVSNCH